MKLGLLVAFLLSTPLFVHSAPNSNSADSFQCPEICNGENDLVDFGVLRSHAYELKINHVINSPAQKSSLRGLIISGKAVISGGVSCTYELKLESVKVFEVAANGDRSEKPAIAKVLEEKRVFFGFEDGTVTGFCPSKTEEPFAWNLKAAILSHLQANLKSANLPSETIEEDISGNCLTRFEVIETTERGLTFVKRKPTAGCGDKYNVLTRYNGILDPSASPSTKSLFVNGEQECLVSLVFHKPLYKSSCRETLSIRDPIDFHWANINEVKVETSLKLVSSGSGGSLEIDEPENYIRSTLHYREDYAPAQIDRSTALDEVVQMLKDISEEQRAVNSTDLLILFEHMKGYSNEDFDALKEYANSETTLDLLFDAAIFVRTEASMNFIEWCLKKANFDLPIGHLSLIPKPSLEYIQEAKKVLTKADFRAFTMVISNLLKSYCESNPHCTEGEVVTDVIKDLEEPIINGCNYSTPDTYEKILDSLRAIGNLGRTSNKSMVYPALSRCLDPGHDRDILIRVTAAEAFRQFSHDSEADDILAEVFKDTAQDIEVRIQAYRSWARYLTQEKLSQLEFLLSEPNEQVKSYIVSHLNEVLRSSDPSKQDEVLLLTNVKSPLMTMVSETRPPFPFTQSFYKEKYISFGQFGGGAEASIIYGPQSKIPRHVDLNLTLDILGYSVNVLELGYHSVYSEGLNNLISHARDKDLCDKMERMTGNEDSNDLRSRLSIRMFGRDISYYDDIDNSDQLSRLFETRPDFIGANETITLPTIGGIMLEIKNLLSIHQDVTYYHGVGAKYGINIVLDAVRSIKVGFNTNEGLLGYSTEESLEMNIPILFTVDLLDRIREFTGFEVGLLGVDSKLTAFKMRRSVKTISPNDKTTIILSGGEPKLLGSSPSILKTLIGLDAGLRSFQDRSTDLITGYELDVAKFDGLFISFIREKPDFSGHFQSLRFEVKRYTMKKSGILTSKELIKFNYLTREIKGDWFTSSTLKVPWNSTYSVSINCNKEGEFAGELNIGNWGANITGNVKSVGTSDFELSAQLIHPDFSVSVNQQTTFGQRYVLAAESTSSILPFVFKTSTDFDTPTQLKHLAELQLPKIKSSVHLEALLQWESWNRIGMFSLMVNKDKTRSKWLGEVVAVNNFGYDRAKDKPLAYNYSLLTSTEFDGNLKTWALGSSMVIKNIDSVKWIVDSKNWIQNFDAEVQLSCDVLSTHVNGREFKLNVKINKNEKTMVESKGVVNMDAAVVISGALNSTFHHPLLCRGEPGRLFVYLSNAKLMKSVNGQIFCGKNWIYKFMNAIDVAKQTQNFHFFNSKGFELSVSSSYTLQISNGVAQKISISNVNIGKEHMYTVYNNLNFSLAEVVERMRVERIADSATVCSVSFSISPNAQFGLMVNLPTVGDGFLLDTGLRLDVNRYRTLAAKSLVIMDSQKRGFEFAFSLGNHSTLPIVLNASLHGIQPNRSFIVDFDVENDGKGFDQAGLLVKTHADDKFIMKISKDVGKVNGEGEFSLLCSIHPGVPRESFTGFLYKTQLSWAFTPDLLKLEQQGEWNGNKATPPGMPFRYGIRFSKNPIVNGGEIQVYAEDTNMGKVFGLEMLEGLYMYEVDTKKRSFELESNILLNWRTYLGRGVIGSQATLKVKLGKTMRNGEAEFVLTLPDANQTQITTEVEFKIDNKAFQITSRALLGSERVHEGKLKTKHEGSSWNIDLNAEIRDLFVKFSYDGDFSLPPLFELRTLVEKTKVELAKLVISATHKKLPKLRFHFAPTGISGGKMNTIDAKLESNIPLKDISLTNLDIEGYFKTQPIISDCEFKLKTGKDLRLVKTSIFVRHPNVFHKAESTFKISEDGKSLAFDVHIDSPLMTKGPLKLSAKHACSSGHDGDYEYDLQCSGQENYSMVLKNMKTSKRVFEGMIATFTRILSGTTSVVMNADDKHILRLIFVGGGNSSGEVNLYLKLDNKVIFDAASSGKLTFSDNGFLVDFWMTLHGANGSLASAELKLSNIPGRQGIDVLMSSSVDLKRHVFALIVDTEYLLNLMTNPEGSKLSSQLKRYLLRFDDYAFGLEFTTSSAYMITCSLPGLSVPVALRFAYDISHQNVLRAVFQVSEPLQLEARVQFDLDGQIYLALSNKIEVLASITYMRLTDLLGGKRISFINGGCANGLSDCLSVVLGSDARVTNQLQFIFSMVFPISDKVNSIVIESEFRGRAPRSLFVATRDREAGFGAWIDRENGTVYFETAWHRRKGGFLAVTVGRQYFKIGDLKRIIDIGKVNGTYYIYATNLETGSQTRYLEVIAHDRTELEVKSVLLKDPIYFIYREDGQQKNLKLFRRTMNDPTTLLMEFSLLQKPLGQLHSRSLITLTLNNKSILIDMIRDESAVKRRIASNISIDSNQSEFYYENVPGRKIFLNFSDSIVLEISKEQKHNGATGNIAVQYKKRTPLIKALFRTFNEPMRLLAAMKTAEAEAVFESNMTSLLNVAGSLSHNADGDNILDAELSTYLDEESGLYHLNGFWRSGLIYDSLVSGMKNTITSKIPYIMAEVEENLMSLFVDGLNQMCYLFDENAVEQTWVAIMEHITDLLTSFNGSSSIGTIEPSNITLAKRAEALYDRIIELMDKIQKSIANLDPRELCSPERITKLLQAVESFSRKALNNLKELLKVSLWILQKQIRAFFDKVSTNVNFFTSVLIDVADKLTKSFDQLSQSISDLKFLREGVTNMALEVGEALKLVRNIHQNTFGPFCKSLAEGLYTPLSVLDHMKANTFEADFSNITINATLFLPLWLRRSAGLIVSPYCGYPLSDTPFEKFLSKFGLIFHGANGPKRPPCKLFRKPHELLQTYPYKNSSLSACAWKS